LGAFGSGPVESEINYFIKWLEIFDHRIIDKLDYGGLVAGTSFEDVVSINRPTGISG
jgi:hypothetical protein